MQYFERAKKASLSLKVTDTETKNKALLSIAKALRENISDILKANEIDIQVAKENGVTNMLDRLLLNEQRILSIANDVEKVVSLPDPVGDVIEEWTVENGLKIVVTLKKDAKSTPLNYIAFIKQKDRKCGLFYNKNVLLL